MNLNARVLVGDNRKRLRELPEGSVQCVVTSPPYWGLRDYGTATWVGGDEACDHQTARSRGDDFKDGDKQATSKGSRPNKLWVCGCGAVREDDQIGLESTPAEFVEQLCLVFDEVWRVLADDGTLWLNLGDTYCTIPHGSKGVNAPQSFEHKGSQNRGQDRNGAATSGGGHANRKPLPGLKHKDLVGIPWRVAFALQERGWYLRQDIIWAKPNPMPESVTDRCTKSHEYIFLLTKQPKYYFNHESIKEPATTNVGNAQIRFGNNKYGDSDDPKHATKSGNVYEPGETRNKRDVWQVATKPYAEAHFATYPPELITPCILAGSKPGDVVLDPFSGSGTTGQVALQLGRNYVGCELNPEYALLSEKRISDGVGMFGSISVE